ncbi:hypothetical protein [Spirillospora sp. NPDC047279]|uniref:hypothetical protein n=1 Tax=Spirillospora sp. NPDC047279 TaxID=3155478 RepID=UPI0033D7BBDC
MTIKSATTAITAVAAFGVLAPAATALAAPSAPARTAVKAAAAPAAAPAPAAAKKATCGSHPWDVSATLKGYGVKVGKVKASAHQWRVTDLTYGYIKTRKRGVKITVESKKHGKCGWFKARPNGDGTYERRTGTLPNRSDSIRVCLKVPGHKAKCGKWKKEGADG